MWRTVIILALHFIHVSSLSGVRTGSILSGRAAHRVVRGAHHGHCHLGIATADRGRMMGSLQCGTARAASTTVPTTPPTLSQLWLPMQPAIRAANQLVCRVWESLKESGTIFTRCALKLTAAALLMLSMVLSSPSISRAARSDAKEAIISQQSVKQKKQNRVDDNKKTQSRVIDNKKTQIKVDDNKKTQIKVDNNSKKTQNKVVDSKKTQNKAVDNKKTESRVVDNKKTPSSKALSLAGDSESVVRSKQLTNFGLLLVGCSALYVVATGSNSGSARRGARKGAADLSSDYDDGYGSSRGAAVVPPRRSPLGRRGVLSRAPQRFEDLLGDQDEADPLFDDILPPVSDSSTTAAAKGSKVETTSSDAASQQVPAISIPMGRQKMTSKLVGSQSDDPSVDSSKLTSSTVTSALLPPYAAIIAAPEESKLLLESASSPPAPSMTTPPNAATTTAAASSKRQQQQPGILGRLFQKPGAGRPSDLRAALRPEQDESHDYRVLVASSLSVYVPPGTIVEVEKGGSLSSADPDAFSSSSEVRQSALAAEMAYAGLSEQEAAECFADVASAMIVQLVDKAVQLSDKDKDKGGGQQQWEAAVVRSLDGLTDLIKGAGELFSKATPSAQIEPIQYNGKANKGKLENLYYYYARSAMDVNSMMGLVLGGLGSGEDTPSSGVDPAVEAADKADRLGKVQFLFNIKEGKRSSIEQRITREVMMSVSKELNAGGGGGDMSKMMEAFSGKGNPDLMMDDLMNGGGFHIS